MKVGIAIHIEKDPYETIRRNVEELGLHNGQLLVWDMSLYNENSVEEVKRACRDFDFEVTGVWCGWSGKVIWSYPEKYRTVGLVPAETREQRVKDILQGAWFANEIGVKTIITHPGYVPDSPFDETHIAVVEAMRHICKEIQKNGQRFIFETGELLPVTMVQLFLYIYNKSS